MNNAIDADSALAFDKVPPPARVTVPSAQAVPLAGTMLLLMLFLLFCQYSVANGTKTYFYYHNIFLKD